jgi:hypothetical protein
MKSFFVCVKVDLDDDDDAIYDYGTFSIVDWMRFDTSRNGINAISVDFNKTLVVEQLS